MAKAATKAPAPAASAQVKQNILYTEEKAQRLFRTWSALLSMSLLIGWQQIMILRPLQEEAKEMENMDPSEIVAVPFPLERVTGFCVFPVVILMIYWLVKNPSTLTWNILNLIKLTGVVYALFALGGNSLIENWKHSLATALYVATLLATTAKETQSSNLLEELPFYDVEDIIATSRLYTTLLCTIPFQILNVLDHGMQVQRWPAPVLMGATYGYAFGTLTGILTNYIANQRKESKMQ